jgi:hypothetical protein
LLKGFSLIFQRDHRDHTNHGAPMLRILLCMVRFSRVTRRTLLRHGRTRRHRLVLTLPHIERPAPLLHVVELEQLKREFEALNSIKNFAIGFGRRGDNCRYDSIVAFAISIWFNAHCPNHFSQNGEAPAFRQPTLF